MRKFVVPLDKISVDSSHCPHWSAMVVQVDERHFPGYSLGYISPKHSGRQQTGGQLVPGPWAFAFANATVIAVRGGTREEIDQAKESGRLLKISMGDILVIDGNDFKVEPDHNNQIKLTLCS